MYKAKLHLVGRLSVEKWPAYSTILLYIGRLQPGQMARTWGNGQAEKEQHFL